MATFLARLQHCQHTDETSSRSLGVKATAICLGLFSNQGDKMQMGLGKDRDEEAKTKKETEIGLLSRQLSSIHTTQ